MRINDLCDAVTPDLLMSMDIFLNGYRKVQTLADDKIALEKFAFTQQWKHRFDFTEHLFKHENAVMVTNPQLRIVYASSNILALTGYLPEEIIGNTPVMFQGQQTDPVAKAVMRQAIERNVPFDTSVVNYRKNGSPYTCHIKSFPIFNRSRKLVNFIAFEKETSIAV